MADTLGNLSLSDMKWLGNKTDLITPLMSGQTWALRKQQAQQSADMHPLKMQEMKSSTAYRDQQTSLAAQRERFNSLTETSRVNTADALSRSADAAARVATGSVDAGISLNRSNASLAEVRANIAKATETTAKLAQDANNMRAVTNQKINFDTADAQIAAVNHKTSLLGDAAAVSKATLTNQIESSNLSLQRDKNNIEGQNLVLQQARRDEANTTNGIPKVAQYKEMMDTAYEQKQYSIIDNMTFSGVTGKQSEELDKYRAGIRRTEAVKDHQAQVAAENDRDLAEQTGVLAGWKTFSPKQRGLFEDTTATGQKKFRNADNSLNDDGKDLAHRLTEWNRITEGMTPSAKGKIVTHLNPNPQLTGGLGIPAGPMNPNGETVKGVFIPSEEGLEAAEKAVLSAKAAKTTAQITQAGDYGLVITGATLKDGKTEYTFARGMPTPSEFGKQVLAEVKDITDNAATLGLVDDDGVVDMPAVYREALKRSGMANTPFARNADDAKGLNLGPGDRYFNINNGRMEQINDKGASVPAGSDRSHLDTQAERDRIAARHKSDEAAAAERLERGELLKSFKPMVDADTKAKAKQKQMQAAAKAKVIADHKAAVAATAAKLLDLRSEQLKLLNLQQKQNNEGNRASAKATGTKLKEISEQIKELEKKK